VCTELCPSSASDDACSPSSTSRDDGDGADENNGPASGVRVDGGAGVARRGAGAARGVAARAAARAREALTSALAVATAA
jgi:hypothetical protein